MRPCTSFTGVALPALLLVGVAGCDDYPVTTPSDGDGTLVDVSMSPGDTRFEYRSESAEGPGGSTFPGPLVIAGSNVRYDEETSALIVDLTVRNEGEAILPMPVSLVLVHLAPEGVTVLDADNGETGPGARIDFDFANDDLHWTPGEESFRRSVSFGVEPGVSVAFAARFLVGPPEDEVGGRIGGIVWNDADGDGERDADERGIPDVRLRLVAHEDSSDVGTRTNEEGRYVFRGLSPGSYTVAKLPRDDLVPTTPSRLTVLLTGSEGEVNDFLDADFGCRVHEHTMVVVTPETEIDRGE